MIIHNYGKRVRPKPEKVTIKYGTYRGATFLLAPPVKTHKEAFFEKEIIKVIERHIKK